MPAFAFTVLGLQTSAPIVSILFAWVLRRELRSSCFHDNLFTCRASPTWFYVFGYTRSTLEFKESSCCLPLCLREGNSMTAVMKLERLCGYALVWNVNLILYSLFSHNTRCLTKLWIEILNIWIYLRIWSRSLMLGMYAFRTRFTFIALRCSSFLFEFYKIYGIIDSII